jgi:hypothetical protein
MRELPCRSTVLYSETNRCGDGLQKKNTSIVNEYSSVVQVIVWGVSVMVEITILQFASCSKRKQNTPYLDDMLGCFTAYI